MNLLEIEEVQGRAFSTAYLNNVRSLIATFDGLLVKANFIMLPGDEIVEKKHQNIKLLTAAMTNTDMSKRPTRAWPGLGENVLVINYDEMLAEPGADDTDQDEQPADPEPREENELTGDVSLKNTDHHKSIVKARNRYYELYKTRFLSSVADIKSKYDTLRNEEDRFSAYWTRNLAEITKKHI